MNRRRIALALTTLTYAWFLHFWATTHTANESARVYFVQAVVDYGTVSLDPVLARYGVRNPDAVVFEGRSYMDKAPGLSLLAIPVWWVGTRVFGLSTELDQVHRLHWLMSVFTVAIPAALSLIWLWQLVFEWTRERWAADVAVAALGLASSWALYASLFFGHALAGALGIGSLLMARRGRMIGCGALGGAMVLVDTVTAPLAGLITLYGAWRAGGSTGQRVRGLVQSGIGALPFLTAQFAYNAALFGSPLTFAYAFKVVPEFVDIHSQGVYGIALPTWAAIGGLSFSTERGLFFFGPLLLLGLVELVRGARDPDRGWLLFTFVAYYLWIAGFVVWRAGECYGPRHLTPILPIAAVGVGLSVARGWPRWLQIGAIGAGVAGIVINWLPMATWPYAPEEFTNPVFQLALVQLLRGTVSASMGSLAGVPATAAAWIGLALAMAAGAVLLWNHITGSRARWVNATGGLMLGAAFLALVAVSTPEPVMLAEQRGARIECLLGKRDQGRTLCLEAGGVPMPPSCHCAPGVR